MEVSVEQLLQIIGEEHVKVALLEKRVEQLRQLVEKQAKETKEK